jgi:hypothetical protein
MLIVMTSAPPVQSLIELLKFLAMPEGLPVMLRGGLVAVMVEFWAAWILRARRTEMMSSCQMGEIGHANAILCGGEYAIDPNQYVYPPVIHWVRSSVALTSATTGCESLQAGQLDTARRFMRLLASQYQQARFIPDPPKQRRQR